MLLGFSFALVQSLPLAEDIKRHELIKAFQVSEADRRPVEALAQWHAQKQGWPSIEDERALLDVICRMGIAGCRALRERWKGKSRSQIQWDILQMAMSPETSSLAS